MDGQVDYTQLDRPTVMRQQAARENEPTVEMPEDDPDYLDIPAFLRRQAD